MKQKFVLSHSEAWKMIEGIRGRLEPENKGAAIAIVDDHGELIAFLRTDGCKLPSLTIAMNKAFTAAREKKPSKAIGESSQNAPFPMSNFGDPRYTGWGGGVPIIVNDETIGAIGISGLPEAEDISLAQEAVDALLQQLA